MENFGLYLFGYFVFIAGLGLAAFLLGAPPLWIFVGVLILLGIGIFTGVTKTQRKE